MGLLDQFEWQESNRPILFNTEMVRAILDGRKTQTRRVVRGIEGLNVCRAEPSEGAYESLAEWDLLCGWSHKNGMYDAVKSIRAPYAVGDVLWVRETWVNIPVSPGGHFRIGGRYYYKADGDRRPEGWQGAWRPSVHMPAGAARIFLKVRDIRMERLQLMDDAAAISEGFCDSPAEAVSPLARFAAQWNKTIKRDKLCKYGYYANPWVWVIDFERCEKPEGWPTCGAKMYNAKGTNVPTNGGEEE